SSRLKIRDSSASLGMTRRTIGGHEPALWRRLRRSRSDAIYFRPAFDRNALQLFSLERFYWFGLRDFLAAPFTGAPSIIVPKIEHRLTEVFNNVAAVEIDVLH